MGYLVQNIIYISTFILLFLAVMLIKKSDEKQEIIVWIPVSLFSVLLIQSIIATIINWLGFSITLLPLGVFFLGISVSLIFLIAKRIGIQAYRIPSIVDVVAVVLIIYAAIWFAKTYFGPNLSLRFYMVDGATHYSFAWMVATGKGFAANLYFEALNDGVIMLIARVFGTTSIIAEKAFVVSQVLSLTMSVLLFYAFIRSQSRKNFLTIIGLAISFVYAYGYPLYAVVSGFAYFATSINLILGLFILISLHENTKINKWVTIVHCNLFLFGLFICYTFFIPVVFFSLFFYIWWHYARTEKKLISKGLVIAELQTFALPTLLGMIISFGNVSELGSGGGITNDGGAYVDLYSNFLLLLIPSILGMLIIIRKTHKDVFVLISTVLSVLFWCLLILMNLKHRASLYYVSKIYNMLWLCCFLLVMVSIKYCIEEFLELIVAITLAGALLFSFIKVKVPERVVEANSYINAYGVVWSDYTSLIPNIFAYMKVWEGVPVRVTDEQAELYEYVRANLSNETEKNVIMDGDGYSTVWYMKITSRQNVVNGDTKKRSKSANSKYVVDLLQNDETSLQEKYGTGAHILFQNAAGIVVQNK